VGLVYCRKVLGLIRNQHLSQAGFGLQVMMDWTDPWFFSFIFR
jgi:hypothetical protein